MQDSRFKHPLALILLIRIRISRVLHLPMPKGPLCETIVNCNSVMVDNYNSVIVEKNIYPPTHFVHGFKGGLPISAYLG